MSLREVRSTLKITWIVIGSIVLAGGNRAVSASPKIESGENHVNSREIGSKIPLLNLSLKPTIEQTEAVVCQITFTNPTDDKWYYNASSFLSEYKFIVKDNSGRAIPPTRYGQNRFLFNGIFRNFMGGLAPSQSITRQFTINRLYDMTIPGNYTISVSREITKPSNFVPDESPFIQKTITITSNTVHIKIKPSVINNVAIAPEKTISLPNDNAIPPSDQWHVGDQWKLNVDIFAPDVPLSPKESAADYLNLEQKIAEGKAHTLYNYTMTVKVVDITKVDDKEQVKLVFIPDDKAIYFVKGKRPEITIDRVSHQLVKVDVPEHPNNYTSLLNNQPVIVHSVDGYSAGFPVDIIPQIAPANTAQLSAKYSDMHLDVNRSSTKGAQTIQEKLTVEGKDWFRVTQVWPSGSQWWNEYLKEDFSAQIGMRARLTGESQIKWGPVTNGLQLGISSDDTSTYGGDPVRVHIALRNTLDQSVPVPSLFLGQNLQVKILGDNGGVTPLTELGKTVQAASLSVLPSKMIPPHSILSGDISLDKIYDLSRAGIYSINASAGNSLQESGKLESPVLMIQVKNNN